ncbi:hypothetical protein N7481_009466 [Penicillium waksmanii]|uniref:uncharacterized protein n=1 Tax=Penicillium waksmanii TaxID=69791 RepID=UPI0025470557|nr:uncharacterized protein N7481_009466 [Penicillium waksmanii]KAJ5975759.1 hypothetical protein N7481_009466 [Penicillium waksmanii]
MMKFTTFLAITATVKLIAASPPRITPRDSNGKATVDVSKTTGSAEFLGSDFIYGFPDNGEEAQTFNACRAGGAQTVSTGWGAGGHDQYIGRFESTLSNYRSTRKFNGDFILLIHDLRGSDGSSSDSALEPGDNGAYSEFEKRLAQLKQDINENYMLDLSSSFVGSDITGSNYAQAGLMLCWLGVYYSTVGPICYAVITEVSSNCLRNKSVCLSRIAYYIAQVVCNSINPEMLNPTAGNWRGKTGFSWGGSSAVFLVWAFFRLPETKGKTFEELDILFARGVAARQFAQCEVDAYVESQEAITQRHG